MKQFLKKGEVQLINGGYLSNYDNKPVHNAEFVRLQRRAEYITTFARLAKGKDFKGKKAESLSELRSQVIELLYESTPVVFLTSKKAPKLELTEKLKNEALSFISFQEDSSKVEKINEFMQDFLFLNEFEEFGLFFEDDVVKLNKIYTIEEVLEAVTECVDIID